MPICYESEKSPRRKPPSQLDTRPSLGFNYIVVTAATLPTISDSDQYGEVIEARSNVNVSFVEF